MKSINLLKNVGGFTPPPRNRQVRLTLKLSVQFTLKSTLVIYPPQSPSLTYPQIIFGNLLPFKCEVFEYIVLNIKNS